MKYVILIISTMLFSGSSYADCINLRGDFEAGAPDRACIEGLPNEITHIDLYSFNHKVDSLRVKTATEWKHIHLSGHYVWSTRKISAQGKRYQAAATLMGYFHKRDDGHVELYSIILEDLKTGVKVTGDRRLKNDPNASVGRCRSGQRCK